ncbi:transcription factor bHLH143 [Elaeis guineensis]|uniref:Transcription factor bHLH143 n=1 Tax=Elaeis guineensis var. tenera TaxID=51953 RepID=A0A6I9RGJ0_ELAGV|nr:transcription factor bHLH143 [Elaeis guineensis]XP_010926354.1 transcription factor bHLH143 [Elaeis guineensis]
MGKDFDPWIHLLHSPWRFGNSNCVSTHRQPDVNTNSAVFPTYFNPYGCAFSGNAATPFSGFQAHKSLEKTPALIPPSIHAFGLPEFTNPEKRFLVFDHSGNQTNLIFSSSGALFMSPGPLNPGLDQQGSKETNVSDGDGGEEMHEDTEEIDALLYSDSDDDHKEEEASTGHFPVEMTAVSAEEVASSTVPAKRRRVDVELDASLVDTASSAVAVADHYHDLHADGRNKDTRDDAESSCVRGGEKRELIEEELETRHDSKDGNKRLKRARIQETVGVLRRIIPGGKSKDVATILDEAIRYLMTLKLKTKALGATLP